jgi:hypothetical protein
MVLQHTALLALPSSGLASTAAVAGSADLGPVMLPATAACSADWAMGVTIVMMVHRTLWVL